MTHRLDLDDILHPALLETIESWRDDDDLAPLRARLRGHGTTKSLYDTLAEAVMAAHLCRHGCRVRLEVETPSGRAADFEVTRGATTFYLHVKRAATHRRSARRLTVSARLRSLERIARPYVVKVRWTHTATDAQMQRLVRDAEEFILHARVGDELVVHADDGTEIGGVLVVAPGAGSHVNLVIGLPEGFSDESPRVRKLLTRAHRQFMPRAENVILIASSHPNDYDDFERALLGSHVERWDAFPPSGRRVAHGRAADGFWNGRRYADSRAAGWFLLAPGAEGLDVRLCWREALPPSDALRACLEAIFGPAASPDGG